MDSVSRLTRAVRTNLSPVFGLYPNTTEGTFISGTAKVGNFGDRPMNAERR